MASWLLNRLRSPFRRAAGQALAVRAGWHGNEAWPRQYGNGGGLEGAGRPWGGGPTTGNPISGASFSALQRRSQAAALNSPEAAAGIESWITATIGSGIVASSPDESASTAFQDWGDRADGDGLGDWLAFQGRVMRQLAVDGETLVHLGMSDNGGELRLRQLASNLLDTSLTRDLGGAARIENGVEFDGNGNRVAYHLYKDAQSYATVRVPAADILHVFKPLYPGQCRGVPWLSPALLALNEYSQLTDAMLVGAKVAAMHAGFVTDANGTGSLPYDGQQTGSLLTSGLEPGLIKVLPSGYDIKFSTPQQSQAAVELAKFSLQSIASGLGVPVHLITGDLSQANYSSLRSASIDFRRRVEQVTWHVLVPQFLDPVWRRWQALEMLSGRLDQPAKVSWMPPGWPWVDPEKDATAEVQLIAAGLKSRRQAVAERGYSVEQLDREIAADKAREKALGLDFSTVPVPAATVTRVTRHDAAGRILEYERRAI